MIQKQVAAIPDMAGRGGKRDYQERGALFSSYAAVPISVCSIVKNASLYLKEHPICLEKQKGFLKGVAVYVDGT